MVTVAAAIFASRVTCCVLGDLATWRETEESRYDRERGRKGEGRFEKFSADPCAFSVPVVGVRSSGLLLRSVQQTYYGVIVLQDFLNVLDSPITFRQFNQRRRWHEPFDS